MVFGLSRFAMNDGATTAGTPPATTATPPAATGGASTTPQITSVDDIFNAATDQVMQWEDPSAPGQKPDGFNPDEDYFGDAPETDPANTDQTTNDTDTKPEDKNVTDQGKAPEFKPYTFKATINGEEVERTFSSPEELDQALAKAEVAPRLYKEAKRLRDEVAKYKDDAEFANDIITTAKEDPQEFLRIMESDLIPMDALSSWVYDKYHEFARVANMSPEQQKQYAMQKEAERIIEENRYSRQMLEKQKEIAQRQRAEVEAKQFNSWLGREKSNWETSVPPEYKENVSLAIKSVVAYARRQLDVGEKVTFREMSGMVSKLLTPYKRSMSPAQREREVARAVEAKKDQATTAVQRAAGVASNTRTDATRGKIATTVDDIFEGAVAALSTGRSKWRE